MSLLLILVGIGLLWWGGEVLVRHATRLASALGLTPLVIGLTVVAFGTSAPELAASVVAAVQNAPDIAVGNVIGSNIANLGLILGITGLLVPLRTQARFVRREVPFMIGVSALCVPLVWNGVVGRGEALLLLAILALYLIVLFRSKAPADIEAEFVEELEGWAGERPPSTRGSLVGVLLGIVLLVVGAHAMVEGAIAMARAVGVSERVIGLTVVAFGTSLPELASSIVAAARRAPDLVLGNLVGSNVMNVLAVLGVTALIRPVPVVRDAILIDLEVMLGLSAVVLPFLAVGLRLGRPQAAALIAVYAAWVVSLFV